MKIGILGGGQLGRMLLQAAANYVVETFVLENDSDCPAAHLCNHFVKGDIRDFETVYAFGKGLDAITIEIESVNVAALEKLEAEGVKVYPRPSAIRIIKNKIQQKKFYHQHQIPTSEFFEADSQISNTKLEAFLPFVQKLAEDGYDGKGVQVIRTKEDLTTVWKQPTVIEKMVTIQKEVAVIVAMNDKGETAVYPPAEMIFDPMLNLLDYQISPALLPDEISRIAKETALKLVSALNSPGLFAVELFIDDQNKVWVNETAPRVHNSGHHSIEANFSSQFDMLWRIMLDLPLGNTEAIMPSAIINIIGEEGYNGKALYSGLDKVLEMGHSFVHLYGKAITKSGRKMGHVTIMNHDYEKLRQDANKIKKLLKVIA